MSLWSSSWSLCRTFVLKTNLEFYNVKDRRTVKEWQGCADGKPGFNYYTYRRERCRGWCWSRYRYVRVAKACSSSSWYQARVRRHIAWWNSQAQSKARRTMQTFLDKFPKQVAHIAEQDRLKSTGLSAQGPSLKAAGTPFDPKVARLTCSGGACSLA